MTTIIATGGALGNHRCDARCHEAAPGTDCDCICGGRYHAKGSSEEAGRQLDTDIIDGRLGEELQRVALEYRGGAQAELFA